jgi:hypothetical protein
MFHHDPNTGNQPILYLVYYTEFSTPGLFLGLANVNTRYVMTLKTTVTIQITPRRRRDALFITDFLIMLFTFMRFT